MNYLNSIGSNPRLNDIMLLIFRLFLGFGILTHGFPKLMKLMADEETKFMSFMGLSPDFSLGLAVFAEFVCAIFLILGLFTRIAVVPLIITLMVAAFFSHAGDPFTDREESLLYLLGFILILVMGPGKYSVDGMISSRRESRW